MSIVVSHLVRNGETDKLVTIFPLRIEPQMYAFGIFLVPFRYILLVLHINIYMSPVCWLYKFQSTSTGRYELMKDQPKCMAPSLNSDRFFCSIPVYFSRQSLVSVCSRKFVCPHLMMVWCVEPLVMGCCFDNGFRSCFISFNQYMTREGWPKTKRMYCDLYIFICIVS